MQRHQIFILHSFSTFLRKLFRLNPNTHIPDHSGKIPGDRGMRMKPAIVLLWITADFPTVYMKTLL